MPLDKHIMAVYIFNRTYASYYKARGVSFQITFKMCIKSIMFNYEELDFCFWNEVVLKLC